MTLYLHPDAQGNLAAAYEDAFQTADEIFALTAYLTDWKTFQLAKGCENATLIVGKDFGITRKQALSDALAWKQANRSIAHVYVAEDIDGFHPKIVAWRTDGAHYLIVGSSNLTVAAFETNYEANLRIKITEERYEEITAWIADILAQSVALNQAWINAYTEAKMPAGAKRSTPMPSPHRPVGLIPPRFPGLAAALAERKERASAFEPIRDDFEELVRQCADGRLSGNAFYDWLILNWNRSEWKFQGSGIFRHKRTATDWSLLCRALVAILDCPATRRDATVQAEYDRLEASDRAEVRKAFITEMLCHFFPHDYPLWNDPIVTWLKEEGFASKRPRGLSEGAKYIWLAQQTRAALRADPDYPARNLAELDHVIWAYCRHRGWV
jgi:hypothetical protein